MILVIARKELRALFASPLAWILLAGLVLVLAWIFLMRLDTFIELQPRLAQMPEAPGATELVVAPLFSGAAIVLLMATPILSMRLIAEERRNRTMTMLTSAPISITQIVLGKYVGLCVFLAVVVATAALMGLSLIAGGAIDTGLILANTIGLMLLAMSFAAAGLYLSSLTANPVIAAVATLAVLLASWLLVQASPDPASTIQLLSVTRRFESFNSGLIDSADAAWHAIVITLFVVLTIRRLDRDRLLA